MVPLIPLIDKISGLEEEFLCGFLVSMKVLGDVFQEHTEMVGCEND